MGQGGGRILEVRVRPPATSRVQVFSNSLVFQQFGFGKKWETDRLKEGEKS